MYIRHICRVASVFSGMSPIKYTTLQKKVFHLAVFIDENKFSWGKQTIVLEK